MIPNQFHFIWIGRRFPYVNRLAIESVYQTNPEASITVHYQDPPINNSNWEALKRFAHFIPIHTNNLINSAFSKASTRQALQNTLSNVHANYPAGRSNIIRYLILIKFGGIYLDFDTITLKSFTPLLQHRGFIGEELVFKCDDDRIKGQLGPSFPYFVTLFGLSYYGTIANVRWLSNNSFINIADRFLRSLWGLPKLNNAVLACEPQHPFFLKALEIAVKSDATMRYALGPMLMNTAWTLMDSPQMRRFPPDFFYHIPPSQTIRFFFEPPSGLPQNTYLIHYCSSNHKKIASKFSREYFESPLKKPNLFHSLAQTVVKKIKN